MAAIALRCSAVIILVCLFVAIRCADFEKLRICVVDSKEKGTTGRTNKYCSKLGESANRVKCVFASSRLECLKKISEENAEFGVFSPEDLIVASHNQRMDILVTNEIRFLRKNAFIYSMVAIVRNNVGIEKISDLQGKRFCHSGFGYETDKSDVLSKFFELRVVPQSCDPSLSLIENQLKSSATFFQSACKAGPWSSNETQDADMKLKYSNLCEMCDDPNRCHTTDKYWGRSGVLFCLTDGVGDVAWARYEDVEHHFKKTSSIVKSDDFSYLCLDDTTQPINTTHPCIWAARPLNVILAKRKYAQSVHKMMGSVSSYQTGTWQWALRNLAVSPFESIQPLDSVMTPEDYLANVPGFLSANNLSHCKPHRILRLCISSSVELEKCDWLRRSALAFGIEPEMICIQEYSKKYCFSNILENIADATVAGPDDLYDAERLYDLVPLAYEYVNDEEKTSLVTVIKSKSRISSLSDLKYRKACFPSYKSPGWNSLIQMMRSKNIISPSCDHLKEISQFFGESCIPGLKNAITDAPKSLYALCDTDSSQSMFQGDDGAFRCLATDVGDVAFVLLGTIRRNTGGINKEDWAVDLKSTDFNVLCIDNSTHCYLSSVSSAVMVKPNISEAMINDFFNVFDKFSQVFGDKAKEPRAFSLFEQFHGVNNVIFQDGTKKFVNFNTLKKKVYRTYQEVIDKMVICSASNTLLPCSYLMLLLILLTSLYINK